MSKKFLGTLIGAVVLSLATTAPVFAAGGSHGASRSSAAHSIVGTLSLSSGGGYQIGATQITFAAGAKVRFHSYILPTTGLPTGVRARASVDSKGQVTSLNLFSDANLPKGRSVSGKIEAVVAGASVQIGKYTLALASGATFAYHGRTIAAASVPTGVGARALLNPQAEATRILLMSDPNMPKGNAVTGSITAVSATSITIGKYTLALAPNASVTYHSFSVPVANVPTGVKAHAVLNRQAAVVRLVLFTDSSLPVSRTVTGTVTSISATSITVNGFDLTFAQSAAATYQGQSVALSAIQAGWTAQIQLNSAGDVTTITVLSEAASGSSTTP